MEVIKAILGMAKDVKDIKKAAGRGMFERASPLRSPDVTDGGEGSGNFNHAGRPGEVGGSSPEGSSGAGAWKSKLQKERGKLSKMDSMKKALHLYKAGMFPKDGGKVAVELAKSGGIDAKLDEYFRILEQNGDYSPRNRTTDDNSTVYDGDRETRGIKKIMAEAGVNQKEATRMQREVYEYTAENDADREENAIIDSFLEKMPVYSGEIHRGYPASDEDFAALLKKVPGDKVRMWEDKPSSWSSTYEVAKRYSQPKMDKPNRVLVTCIKNRSGVPVEQYTAYGGEDEVLLSKGAAWTVLRMETGEWGSGGRWANVTVIERGKEGGGV